MAPEFPTLTIRDMADVTDATTGSEPSMEEILASIRRIIADEKDPSAAAPAENGEAPSEDVLELTQMVQDDGSVLDLADKEPAVVLDTAPARAPEPIAMPDPVPPPPPAPPAFDEGDGFISNQAATAATSSLAALANTVQIERRALSPNPTFLGNGSRTLEDMVLELMKPMLKDWLDQNLPPIVDRIVQKEVERIARRLQE